MLSAMLKKRYGIKHEVLNAKVDQAAKEGNLVKDAGQLGSVMITTNMAGRGTDIRLQPVGKEALVKHWKLRNLLPSTANAAMSDDELVALAFGHQAIQTLGLPKGEAKAMGDDELRLRLLRHWCMEDAWLPEKKVNAMDAEQCLAELDKLPDYRRHRLSVFDHVRDMGGLYVLGTERHESRRIDNQLRGRSGRQGDPGSSRFFVSLEDDRMKMFAGNTTQAALSKLGMKEGDAIEHPWVSRSVERAQRKVEERNYENRKVLLDYDEVMEYQRGDFYGTRQDVLEGRNLSGMIFEHLTDSVADAVERYLSPFFAANQVAEWCSNELEISIDPSAVVLDDAEELMEKVRRAGHEEAAAIIEVTLGEYMDQDLTPDAWDYKGLQAWAKHRFDVDLTIDRLKEMSIEEVRSELTRTAQEQFSHKDLAGLNRFLDPLFAEKQLAHWFEEKFGLQIDPESLADVDGTREVQQVADRLTLKAREAYRQRELQYPITFNMRAVLQGMQQDPQWAVNQLLSFANGRFDAGWTAESLNGKSPQELMDQLVEQARLWLGDGEDQGKLAREVADKLDELALTADIETDQDDLRERVNGWLSERFNGLVISAEDWEAAVANERALAKRRGRGVEDLSLRDQETLRGMIHRKAREVFRVELTQLERFVLIQVLDQAWKDHLYAMDQLRGSVGLRGYAERDPRIEYKREGSRNFQSMKKVVRDRVTELIFRAELTPNVQLRSAYGDQQSAARGPAVTAQTGDGAGGVPGAGVGGGAGCVPGAGVSASRMAGAGGASADGAAASGNGDQEAARPMSRRQRRAAKTRARKSTKS